MGLRPARTCREIKHQSWSRYSKKKPRKSYIKSMPHMALNITSMGNPNGYYTLRSDLVSKEGIQIRDNALEAGRLAVNKLLETKIPSNYHFFVRVYPHEIIRERKVVLGAGADRIQKGMKHAWGRPADRAARVHKRTTVYTVRMKKEDISLVKEAYKRAKIKLPGHYSIKITEEIIGTPPEE